MMMEREALRAVLVVDDDADIVETMQLVLESSGCTVLTAAHGREAIDVLEEGARVSLILLDLMMPVADGWWFLEEVARHPSLADIPIVVLTGARLTVDQVAALPVAGLLQKPVSLDDLLTTVQRHCPDQPA